MHVLVLVNGRHPATNDRPPLDALRLYRRRLHRGLGLSFRFHHQLQLPRQASGYHCVLVVGDWRSPVAQLEQLCRHISRQLPHAPILFFDAYDQSSSPHFPLLPYVTRYIKRQVLRDRTWYQHDYCGNYIVTDYLVRRLGFDLKGWSFGSKPAIEHQHKIAVGWNMVLAGRLRGLMRMAPAAARPWRRRRYVFHSRLASAPVNRTGEWYQRYRDFAQQQLRRISRHSTQTGEGRVSRTRYLWELLSSRIVVSPFGWGEVCLRDFEAISAGALLVKPSMAHLETRPDIYREHVTYAPVQWDFSDLEEVCQYYLDHPDQAEQIVQRGQRALWEYCSRGFVDDVHRVFALSGPAAAPIKANDQVVGLCRAEC